MKRVEALEVLGRYTADQWGLVTTAQANAVGADSVTRTRLVEAGQLVSVRRGVYGLSAAGDTPHLAEKAAWLALNPAIPGWQRPKLDPDGGVLSHRSAALLHGLGDLVAESIEITVPRRLTTRDPSVKLRRRALTHDDVTLVDGLPTTTLERTVLDLLDDHVDASHIGGLIHQASTDNRLDLDRLAARMGRFCRRYGLHGRDGHALLEHLLAHVRPSDSLRVTLAELLPRLLQPTAIDHSGQTGARPALTGRQAKLIEQLVRESQLDLVPWIGHDQPGADTDSAHHGDEGNGTA